MNWEAIGAIGEIIGGLVVIGSLIYLALQIRQNSNLARAAAQRDVHATFNSIVYNWNNDAEIVRRALLDFASLSKTEQLIASNNFAPFANHLDQVIRMYQQGYESSDNVQVYGDICMAIVTSPGGRVWWGQLKHLIPKESFAYIEQRLDDPPESLPPPVTESILWFQPEGASEGDSDDA